MAREPRLTIRKRFAVEVERGHDYAPRLHAMAEHPPAGHVTLLPGFGWAFQREIDVFGAVAIGTSFGMGILLTVMAVRSSHAGVVGVVLAVVAYATSCALVVRFALSRGTRLEVSTASGRVLVHRRVYSHRKLILDVASDAVVSVDVVSREGGLVVRLGGPRHEEVGEVYRLRLLDPDSLAAYLAELTAIVARVASDPVQPR